MKKIDNGRRMEVETPPKWQIDTEIAINEAPTLEETEVLDANNYKSIVDFLAGVIGGDEYRRIDKEYCANQRGRVIFSDKEAFLNAVNWILMKLSTGYHSSQYKQHADIIVQHEAEHYQEATEMGVRDIQYLVSFYKDKNKALSFRPAVTFSLPEGLPDSKLRDLLKSIIKAPKELSDSDEAMLL